MTPTIIGTSSFSSSGGSAITNILEEFSTVKPLAGGAEFECKFFTENIFALENTLRLGFGVDKAAKTFLHNAKKASCDAYYQKNFASSFLPLTKEYLESVTQNYLGALYEEYDFEFLDASERKMIEAARSFYNYKSGMRKYEAYEPYHWRPSFAPFGSVYWGGGVTEDFYEKTQHYIQKVFAPLYENGKNYILVDALYKADVVTPNELKYFKASKALIANRDPRDLYVMNKEIYGEWYMPTWTVETWIRYYKFRRRSISEQKAKNAENILHLQFESLIYDYEASLATIKRFLNLSNEEHTKKGQIFIPEKSSENTQVFRKYPQYARDIEKIEKELPEFCYPYSDAQVRHFEACEIKKAERETLEDIRKLACIFQKTGKLPFSTIKGAFLFTIFSRNFQSFKNRRGLVSRLKGAVKLVIGLLILPLDFMRLFIRLKTYQHKNKNRTVEFR